MDEPSHSGNTEVSTTGRITVCIPACDRPAMLEEAILSCTASLHRPLEILVGDDSSSDAAYRLIEGLRMPENMTLGYRWNRPPLGQSANVNALFDRAAGARLILLHDDDLLCAGGIDRLIDTWNRFPEARCVYGKQYVVSASGITLQEESTELNRTYSRESRHEGVQRSALEAALLQQMPNNGFLIDSALAREVRYRSEAEAGQSVDADFAVRVGLAAAPGSFVFVNEFVSSYRLSQTSILRSNRSQGRHLFYRFLENLSVSSPEEAAAQQLILSRLALEASLDAAMAGERSLAFRILSSRYYTKPWLSHWTMLRLLCMASPHAGAYARRLLRN